MENENEKVDTEKYVKLAKERLAKNYKAAVQQNDLVGLKQIQKQIVELDKVGIDDGFTKYIKFLVSDAYNVLINKQKVHNSKSATNLKKSKYDLEHSINIITDSYKNINSLMGSLDERLIGKNDVLQEYHRNLQELETAVQKEEKAQHDLEKTIKIQTDELLKREMTTMREESEFKLASLKSDLSYEKQNYDSSLNDRNMYLSERTDLQTASQIFRFNLSFYKSELNELEFLIQKNSVPSFMETDLAAQIKYHEIDEIKVGVKEVENEKIKLYNNAIESKKSLREVKKDYSTLHQNSPKIKS